MVTLKDISDVYVFMRKNNQSISDEVLDFINLAAKEKLEKINNTDSFIDAVKKGSELFLKCNDKTIDILEKFSVDFLDKENIAVMYDDKLKCVCVSVYHRETEIMRYYNVVDGQLELTHTEEGV